MIARQCDPRIDRRTGRPQLLPPLPMPRDNAAMKEFFIEFFTALALFGVGIIVFGMYIWGGAGMLPVPGVFAGVTFPHNWHWYDVVGWGGIGTGLVISLCGLVGREIAGRHEGRFQFRLRTLMIVVTLLAALCSLGVWLARQWQKWSRESTPAVIDKVDAAAAAENASKMGTQKNSKL